jgi:molybdenum cofactor cytidylyltransferase
MGEPKQLLPIRGKPMLESVLEIFRRSRVDQVFVVLGAYHREVRKKVGFKTETIIYNRGYAKGMSSSLKKGLSAAEAADAAFIALADQPFLSPKTVDKMIEEYLVSRAPIVVPVYRGRRGNPVLFDKSLFPQIMRIHGDSGAKAVVEENDGLVLEVPVQDVGVVADIDTQSEYEDAALRGVRPR